MQHYSAAQTAEHLPFASLVDALAQAVQDYADGSIICPERVVVGAPEGSGLLMAMPCAGPDLLATKLLTICPDNAGTHRPTIQGQVICADARNGELLFSLDGPTVTMRRTAGISLLGIRLLARTPPKKFLIIGTGVQAGAHCAALASLHPTATVFIRGRTPERAMEFCERHKALPLDLRPAAPQDKHFDVIITATASKHILYDECPDPSCLIIGVGAFRPDMIEIGPRIVHASRLYVDDPIGAPSEAGDLIQAGVEWHSVYPLASALQTMPPTGEAIFFKSVGCAAWDLAACRVVQHNNLT